MTSPGGSTVRRTRAWLNSRATCVPGQLAGHQLGTGKCLQVPWEPPALSFCRAKPGPIHVMGPQKAGEGAPTCPQCRTWGGEAHCTLGSCSRITLLTASCWRGAVLPAPSATEFPELCLVLPPDPATKNSLESDRLAQSACPAV